MKDSLAKWQHLASDNATDKERDTALKDYLLKAVCFDDTLPGNTLMSYALLLQALHKEAVDSRAKQQLCKELLKDFEEGSKFPPKVIMDTHRTKKYIIQKQGLDNILNRAYIKQEKGIH